MLFRIQYRPVNFLEKTVMKQLLCNCDCQRSYLSVVSRVQGAQDSAPPFKGWRWSVRPIGMGVLLDEVASEGMLLGEVALKAVLQLED